MCFFFLIFVLLGAIHKLRRQARGEGGLPNVYATTQAYEVNLSTEGEGVNNLQNLVCVICVWPLT